MHSLGILGLPGGTEWIVILVVGLLLFGGRLPEVGKSVARSIMEFRKGLRGLKDEVGLNEFDDIKRDLHDATRPLEDDVYETQRSFERAGYEDYEDAEFNEHGSAANDDIDAAEKAREAEGADGAGDSAKRAANDGDASDGGSGVDPDGAAPDGAPDGAAPDGDAPKSSAPSDTVAREAKRRADAAPKAGEAKDDKPPSFGYTR